MFTKFLNILLLCTITV